MPNAKAAEERPAASRANNRSWIVVLAVLGVLAAALGGVAYWRFTLSDRVLSRSLEQMRSRGSSLTVPECVRALVSWSEGCSAMKTLCDASIPRMVRACLAGRDRGAFCAAVGSETMTTGFGYAECQSISGGDRQRKKACNLAYRSVADHCQKRARSKAP